MIVLQTPVMYSTTPSPFVLSMCVPGCAQMYAKTVSHYGLTVLCWDAALSACGCGCGNRVPSLSLVPSLYLLLILSSITLS